MFYSDYDWLYTTAMRVNMIDTEKDVKVQVTLPGVKKEAIQISLKDEFIHVAVEKAPESGEKPSYLWKEFNEDGYERDILIGRRMKKEEISAAYDNGILTITVPKEQPQTVPVQ